MDRKSIPLDDNEPIEDKDLPSILDSRYKDININMLYLFTDPVISTLLCPFKKCLKNYGCFKRQRIL